MRMTLTIDGKDPYNSLNYSGEWRSLASAPALGAGGRRFESGLSDPMDLAYAAVIAHQDAYA